MIQSIWNDELREKVRVLWATHTSKEIVVALKADGVEVTRNSVIGILHRMGKGVADKCKVHLNTRADLRPAPKRAPQKPQKPRETYRIIPANSWGALRVIKSIIVEEPAPVESADSLGLTIEQLEPHHCRYISGDSLSVDGARYCGAKVFERSYCRFHHKIIYLPPQKKRVAA